MSDYLYRAPSDKIVKLLVEQNVPVYLYVMNTTVEALRLPEWRKYPHDIEHLLLTGAPFMDVGEFEFLLTLPHFGIILSIFITNLLFALYTEFFPKDANFDRLMWTDNDRNMSHFFMKAFSDFARNGYFHHFGNSF